MKAILKSLVVIGLVAGLTIGATRAYFTDTETSSGNIFMAGTIDLAPITSPFATFTDIKPSHVLAPVTVTFKNVGNNGGILKFAYSYVENDKIVDGYCDPAPTPGHYFEFWAGPGTDPNCSNNTQAGMEMNADEFARLIYVTGAQFSTTDVPGPADVLPSWLQYADQNLGGGSGGNGDGKVSLYEMARNIWTLDYDNNPATGVTPLPSGKAVTVVVTFHMGDAFDTCKEGQTWPGCASNYTIQINEAWNVPQADGLDATVSATLSQVGAP